MFSARVGFMIIRFVGHRCSAIFRLSSETCCETITISPFQVYLVAGYILTTSVEVYDVVWTMPHSIHTMKLIGKLQLR